MTNPKINLIIAATTYRKRPANPVRLDFSRRNKFDSSTVEAAMMETGFKRTVK